MVGVYWGWGEEFIGRWGEEFIGRWGEEFIGWWGEEEFIGRWGRSLLVGWGRSLLGGTHMRGGGGAGGRDDVSVVPNRCKLFFLFFCRGGQ